MKKNLPYFRFPRPQKSSNFIQGSTTGYCIASRCLRGFFKFSESGILVFYTKLGIFFNFLTFYVIVQVFHFQGPKIFLEGVIKSSFYWPWNNCQFLNLGKLGDFY